MPVTGTTTFSVTRDQIIEYALRKIGALELGTSADATTISAYTNALNMMVKSWITKGIKLWAIQEITIPLTASTNSYIIGPASTSPTPDITNHKPMKLIQAWLRNTSITPNNDVPLQILSKFNYNEFGSKATTGTCNSVFLDVGRDQSVLKVYPTPDSTTASTYDLYIVTQRQLFDLSTGTDNFDFPVEWYYALGWNFAAEIAVDFGVDAVRLQYIEGKAAKFLDEVEAQDTEYTSVYFTPDSRNNK